MVSHAAVMRAYGPPEVLRFERVALPPLAPDEIRIESLASAVNHSDLEIRAGRWPVQKDPPFPYVPGLEVIGAVTETGGAVRDLRIGDRVMTMMQGLGGVRAKRPGGYAEHVTVAASAAAPVSREIDPYDVAALGLAAVTAFEGLSRLGPIERRRVAVTGASGGVGSAAIGVARAQGAEVVAVVSRPERAPYVRALGAREAVTSAEVARGALGEGTVDGVLDTVAGDLFGPCLAAIRPGGRFALVGAVGGSTVSFDAYRLMEVTLTGYSSENLDGPALRRAVTAIGEWIRRKILTPPSRTVMPLQDAAAAHTLLERRGVEGRVLLVPERA